MNDLVDELRAIVGARHVHDRSENLDRWEVEPMRKYHSRARAVVCPGSTQEVAAIMRLAHETATPVVPVGGNTGLAGGTFAGDDERAIMLSLERMNRIREIRPASRIAIVEAGVVLDTLHQTAAEHDLIFPLTFGARGSCTIGGNLSTNAGGSNVVRYGNTRDLCLGIEVVTPQGRIVDLMSELHKDNTGYSLKNLY
ncbi:MAG: FAD-binding oxidoreductase, partial [Alphaproteobacteria bacterium]